MTIKLTFRPKKVLNFMKMNKKMLSTCDECVKKRERVCERNGFYANSRIALTHHHGDFLHFVFCEHFYLLGVPEVICPSTNVCCPLHVALQHYVSSNPKRDVSLSEVPS